MRALLAIALALLTSAAIAASSGSEVGGCSSGRVITGLNLNAPPTCGQLAASSLSNGTTGSGSIVLATSPTLTTPILGVAAATSINTVTMPSTSTGTGGFVFASAPTITSPAIATKAVFGNGAEPACDAAARGTLVMVQGGAGVADTFRICTKDSGDLYGFRALF